MRPAASTLRLVEQLGGRDAVRAMSDAELLKIPGIGRGRFRSLRRATGRRYILNSAVVTAPGRYEYRLVDAAAARRWLLDAPEPESAIGYAETAEAFSAALGVPIPVDRRIITMSPGDEALVLRLVFPPGTPRINLGDKGNLSPEYILRHAEMGVLRREE